MVLGGSHVEAECIPDRVLPLREVLGEERLEGRV